MYFTKLLNVVVIKRVVTIEVIIHCFDICS